MAKAEELLWNSDNADYCKHGPHFRTCCRILSAMQKASLTVTESKLHCVSEKKTCDYIFYNNFNSKCPITIIFGIVISKSRRHGKMVSFPTSPI